MDNQSSQGPTNISLPKGGGAIKGIGETFQPNVFTGTGDFSVPIVTSPGRTGFGPQLTLQYSTGNGNGPFGLGWQLSIPRITRKTEKGLPRYTDDDVFVLSGAEDLVVADQQPPPGYAPAGYTVTRFRPRTEGLFARIERWVRNLDADTHWRAITRDNVTSLYGKSTSARIADPANLRHVYQWLLEESFDSKGNHILYEYIKESADRPSDAVFEQNRHYTQAYVRRILYGNTPDNLPEERRVGPVRSGTNHRRHRDPERSLTRHYLFEVLFDYGDLPAPFSVPWSQPSPETSIPDTWPVREDRFSTFRPGFEVRTLRRCNRVLMLHHFDEGELAGAPLVKSTNFSYQVDLNTHLSFLTSVSVVGHRKGDDGHYLSAGMPPVEFSYSSFEPEKQRYQSVTAKGDDLPPRSLNAAGFTLVDLFGDGLPDVLRTSTAGYDVWENLGDGHIDRRRPQQDGIPPVSLSQSGVALGDMGGDGLADVIVDAPPISGFFEATPDGQWQPFKRFARFPSVDLADPNLRIVDLTGDGLPDLLITRESHFLWFRCLGEEGYAEPRTVARLHDLDAFPDIYFSDPAGRARLADMTGDGLNDIVLMHDGRIDYWPNLGYGRFGSRITMAASPRIGYGFDPRRLFLVDLDGSGCADIVYVDADRVHFWFNRSGNGWSEQQTIRGTPPVTDLTSIQFADFYGTGTASVVWSYDYNFQSGGNYKVLDFCGGQKPHLLTEVSNNLGATTRVQYASSTQFYLEDRANGHPWITALPFPVQVVEKVEVIDHIGKTKLVTRYKYHHGYFDGREREFRGFGRVDQFDSEVFEQFSAAGLHGMDAPFDNRDPAFHRPPVETRTWFHTGIYFDPDHHLDHRELSQRYQAEFCRGDSQAFELPEHEFEQADGSPIAGGATHETFRVLRGAILRSEVYARDGTTSQTHPYSVSESRYRIKALQEPRNGRHGVYLTNARERLSYHYERNPEDPRVAHEMTLAVDGFGNVTQSAAVAYPRRAPEHTEQGQTLITYAEADFINTADENDWYRVGVPLETRAYELTGVRRADEKRPFTIEEIADAAADATILPYEAEPNPVSSQKRLLDATCSLYLSQDLAGPLPPGTVGPQGLPYESYRMAFTPGLVEGVFNRDEDRVDEQLLADQGKYFRGRDIQETGDLRDDAWWVPSGHQRFSETEFYLPMAYTDPFGNTVHTTYDDYSLLIRQTHDPLANTVSVLNDYRVLQPWQLTDPNGNRSQVAFDALGLVVGTAVMGKEDENVGDTLVGFVADLDDEIR
jgi:YD repeat-containing protein